MISGACVSSAATLWRKWGNQANVYRLLTEAEWEYAARAGTTTAYSYGDTISKQQAQFSEGTLGSAEKTAEVGIFPANSYGLHDMHGNVWEWVEDCYGDSYKWDSIDGSKATGPKDCSRILRGGSWYYDPQYLRSANRGSSQPGNRNVVLGFRLARTLNPSL